jgi:hypothetical protein
VGFVDNNVTDTVIAGIVVERAVPAPATKAPVVERGALELPVERLLPNAATARWW